MMNIKSLHENQMKSRISEGIFYAIGSHEKYFLSKVHQEDDCGVDYELKNIININGKPVPTGGNLLEFQLKSTQNYVLNDNSVKYDLEVDAYKKMILRNQLGTIPLILILMCLPSEEDISWIECRDSEIIFRKSLFWYITESTIIPENKSTYRIEIPKTQILNCESFTNIVNRYSIKNVSK